MWPGPATGDTTMAIPIMRSEGYERSIGIAIAVPEPYAQLVRQVRMQANDPLAPIIPPHITLLPPTSVDIRALPAIQAHLAKAAAKIAPFVLRLRGTGSFRPVSQVVFLNVTQGERQCGELAAHINSGLLHQDLRFNYHPHVTLAHDVPAHALDDAAAKLAQFDATFAVSAFTLYEYSSDHVWRTVAEFPLSSPPPRSDIS